MISIRYLQVLLLIITYSVTASKLDAWAYEIGLIHTTPSIVVVPVLTFLYFISFRKSLIFSIFILKKTSIFFIMILIISLFYIFLFFFDKYPVSIDLYFLPLLSGFFILIVCSVARDIQVIRKISLWLLLLSAGSVYADYIDPSLLGLNQNRAAGFSMNPNGAAVAIVFSFLILIEFEGSFKKNLIIFLFCFGAIFLTFSRGGLLVFIIASIFWLYNYKGYSRISGRDQHTKLALPFSRSTGCSYGPHRNWMVPKEPSKNHKFNRKKIIFLVAAFLFSFLFFNDFLSILYSKEQQTVDAMISRINPLDQRSQLERDDSRLAIILIYLDLITDSPILGYGTGFNYNHWLHAHNTFLNIYIEGGLFSFLSFLYMFFFLIIKSIKNNDNKSIIITLSIFLFCFFNNQLFINRAAILGFVYVIFNIALRSRIYSIKRIK